MGLYSNPLTVVRLQSLRRATACVGFRIAIGMAAALILGSGTTQAERVRPEHSLESLAPQVTISWSLVVHRPGTVLRIYRGLVGGPMAVIVEREIAMGRTDGSWVDQVVAPGVLVYQLRYVQQDGDEVTLGTRFGAIGAMQEVPRSVLTLFDDVVADLARVSGLNALRVAETSGFRFVLGDLFRPHPPDPIPRCELI